MDFCFGSQKSTGFSRYRCFVCSSVAHPGYAVAFPPIDPSATVCNLVGTLRPHKSTLGHVEQGIQRLPVVAHSISWSVFSTLISSLWFLCYPGRNRRR